MISGQRCIHVWSNKHVRNKGDKINNVSDNSKKATKLLKEFAMKYYPNEQKVDEEIAQAGKAAQMFEIEIEHMSGKEVQER